MAQRGGVLRGLWLRSRPAVNVYLGVHTAVLRAVKCCARLNTLALHPVMTGEAWQRVARLVFWLQLFRNWFLLIS